MIANAPQNVSAEPGDAIEELARLQLRIGCDVGHGGNRIAEHFAPVALGEEFAFAQRGEELHHRRLDRIDLGLVGLGRIPAFPVDRGKRAKLGAGLAHPGDQLLVGAAAGNAAVEDEIDEAVAAGPKDPVARAFDRAPGDEGAGARRLDAEEVDEGRRVRGRSHHRSLGGDVDAVAAAAAAAAAGGIALEQRNERADRRLRSRPAIGLRLADPHRHALRLAGERHRSAGRHCLDIGSLPGAARADRAERRDHHHDHVRVAPPQNFGIERHADERPA